MLFLTRAILNNAPDSLVNNEVRIRIIQKRNALSIILTMPRRWELHRLNRKSPRSSSSMTLTYLSHRSFESTRVNLTSILWSSSVKEKGREREKEKEKLILMYTSKAHRIKSTWLSIMMNLDILSSAVNDGRKLLFELSQWGLFFPSLPRWYSLNTF